ncbi:MAG: DUF4126 domain-containing protein [Desulfomicrobium escambiense]|nr:DUF4126 domain-containing protein [Desulfomicrobium escambiense]
MNGYSTSFPEGYARAAAILNSWPSEDAVTLAVRLGVDLVIIEGGFRTMPTKPGSTEKHGREPYGWPDEGATMETVASVLIGVGLSATCGFRIFVPLLVMSIAGQLNLLELSPTFAWIESVPALIAFGVATVLELLAYLIPLVDNALNARDNPLTVVAGTGDHRGRDTRPEPIPHLDAGSDSGRRCIPRRQRGQQSPSRRFNGGNGGAANPVLSAVESVFSAIMSVLSVLVPVLAVILLALARRYLATGF